MATKQRLTLRSRDIACFCVVAAAVLVTGALLIAAYGTVRQVSVTVEDAWLGRFTLLTSPLAALGYNLSLKLAVRNPNWAMGIKNTRPLEAAYSFHGQQFDRVQVSIEGDEQPARTTRFYHLVTGSSSRNYVALGDAGVAEHKKQNATGTFEVELKLTGEVRYTSHNSKCRLEATCPLKLQLAPSPGSGKPVVFVFAKVKCKLTKPDKNC